MDYHVKNVCLIGILYSFCCLSYMSASITRAIRVRYYNDNDPFLHIFDMPPHVNPSEELFYIWAFGVAFGLLSILSFEMVLGAVKKRHQLMAPFIIINLLLYAAIVLSSLFLMASEYKIFGLYNSVQEISLVIVLPIILFYPVGTLFLKLRAQAAAAKTNENLTLVCENN